VVQHCRKASQTAFKVAINKNAAEVKEVPASTILRVGRFLPLNTRYIRSIRSSLLKTTSSGILTWNVIGPDEYRTHLSHEELMSCRLFRVSGVSEFG
jgi:hypothetical protein